MRRLWYFLIVVSLFVGWSGVDPALVEARGAEDIDVVSVLEANTGNTLSNPLFAVPPAQPISCALVTEIPVTECEALVALYNATDGDNWIDNTGWTVTTTPCDWYSVSCDSGHVSNLSLAANQLTGSIPPELGNLTILEHLNLYANQLDGSIPSELGNLAYLEYLDLSCNQLDGSIPPQLGNLSYLMYLDLHENQLTGRIPAGLDNLTNLKFLYLNSNQLGGNIPPELGNLINLSYLWLSTNQFEGSIPSQLGNLTNLETLFLYSNLLSSALPSSLTQLADLETFYFFDTDLCEPSDPAFNAWLAGIPNVTGTNVDCGQPPFSVSGLVADTGGTPLAGVVVADGAGHDATSDGSGHYTATQLITGTYTFTPSLAGYSFSPVSRTVVVPPDRTYQDFTAQAIPICDVVTQIPQKECEALVALYNATDGDNWTDNTGWTVTSTPCDWYGVGCSAGQVSSLSLRLNQLDGSIPPELGNLADLEVLDLVWNQLEGNIPLELGNLVNLEELSLTYNQLESSIPPELGNLASLAILSLSSNQLEGSIPPELGDLTALERLYLQSNQLSGNIPPELGNLADLKRLYLDSNQLSGSIPPELGNLTSLCELSLHTNQLDGSIPPELGTLAHLEQLSLQVNQLNGSIPSELGDLVSLSSLRLATNQLDGNIPPKLGNLGNLRQLDLFSNQLNGALPSSLTRLANLDVFYFHDTDLCEPSDANFQAWLASIPDLSGTGVACGQPPYSVSGEVAETGGISLAGVVVADGAGHSTTSDGSGHYTVTQLITGTYTFTPSLAGYSFSPISRTMVVPPDQAGQDFTAQEICETVTQIPQEECDALVALYNATNGENWTNNAGWTITTTPCDWYGVDCDSGYVRALTLHSNQLSGSIPLELSNLTNLEVLWLYSNQLSSGIPPALGTLTNLEGLLLYGNELSGSIPPELGNLANLKHLWLMSNQLTGSIPPELGSLANLAELWLDGNQLEGSIPPQLGNLGNLRDLDLSRNQLNGALPSSLTQLANLDVFYFYDTNLCEPIDAAFQMWLSGVFDVRGTGVYCTQTYDVTPSEGGSLIYTGLQAGQPVTTSIQVPPNAVTKVTSLAYQQQATTTHPLPGDFVFANTSFKLDAYQGGVLQPGFAFAQPVTLTIEYNPDGLNGVGENTLELRFWDGSQWSNEGINIVSRDVVNHRLVVTINHLTEFGVFGATTPMPDADQQMIYLPVVFKPEQ